MKPVSPTTTLISRIVPALCVLALAAQTLCAAPGDPDLTFGTNGVVAGEFFTSIGLQSDGKILAVSEQSIRRFLPNGSADTAFAGGTGVVTIPFPASGHERALAVLPDNKIVVAGSLNEDFALLRLKADGTRDDTFGPEGVKGVNILTYQLFPFSPPGPPVTFTSVDTGLGVLPLPDGRMVAVGSCAVREFVGGPALEQRMAACTLDASGQVTGTGSRSETQKRVTVSNFVLLPNGHVLITGHVFGIVAAEYYTNDGAMGLIDYVRDLNYPAELDDQAFGAAARPDGAVLLAGSGGASGTFLAGLRYLDGNNRWQFDSPRVVSLSLPFGISLALQPDGRIVMGGPFLTRYMPDGNLDFSFRTLDEVIVINALALQSDGKILTAGGELRRFEGTSASATMAVELPAGTPFPGGGGAPVNFGTLNTGATGSKTFTVRNTSATMPLHLWKTVKEGPSAAEITTDKTFPLTIAPGGSTAFTLQWAPVVPGPLSATFHLLNSDSARRSLDVYLTGYALTTLPKIEVREDGLTPFDTGVFLSHFRPRVSLTFTNAGQQQLNFTPVQIEGSPAAFSYTSPLPASLAPAAAHTCAIEYLPGDNPVSAVFHFGSNDTSANPFNVYVTGNPSTSSSIWRLTWLSGIFTPDAEDMGDYDGDGMVNLLEYATFNNPRAGGPNGITLTKKGAVLEYTFTRPYEAITELLYELEWTDSLADGVWKTLGTSSTILSDDGVRQQVKFTVPAGSGDRFVRLKVTRVPG